MSPAELRKRLIDKIQNTYDENLIQAAYRLFDGEIEIYKLSEDQRKVIHEGRQQIRNGQFLEDDQANKEIDEWLSK